MQKNAFFRALPESPKPTPPTQAFLEDIGLSEEVGSEDGQEVYVEDEEVPEEQALNSQGCRPHTPRQASSFHTVACVQTDH